MSQAPSSITYFQHSNGVDFAYEPNNPSDSWLPVINYPHRVWVSCNPINDSGWRYANVKKTVAYVVVDVDGNGQPVIEKWSIKYHITSV